MWGYESGYSWEDRAAEGLAGVVILAGIFVAAVSITLVIVLLRELIAVFQRRAFQPTRSAKVLWGSLGVLVLLYAVTAVAASDPDLGPLCAYASAWATLLFVIVAEYVDVHEGGRDAERHGGVDELDSYLGAFTPIAAVTTNGHTPAGVP